MGLKFFDLIDINSTTEKLTVRLMHCNDQGLWNTTLDPLHTM